MAICVLTILLGALSVRLHSQRAGVERVNGSDATPGEVIVKFRSAPGRAVVQELRSGAIDADAMRPVGRAGAMRVHSRSLDAATLAARLAARGDVVYAEPNYIVHTFVQPNDPLLPQLWGLAKVHAADAWDVSTGSASHVVAIIDTGVDYTHPDLAANIWSAPSAFQVTIGGTTITCPAGTHGFNAITTTCDPMDDHKHGTHVAGTIGGVGNNGVGVAGVNWTARIMASKFLDASGSGSLGDAVDAIEFVIQTKQRFGAAADVRILSNSWGGGPFSQALLDEINAANDAEMLFVAAAGNNGANTDISPTYPGSYNAPNVVAVAATDDTDTKASFSNYGLTRVDLAAPGVGILSTVIGGGYDTFSGTSMATPHVSGAAALVLSRCAYDTATLKDALLSTVDPVPALASLVATGGRLNVDSAVRSCTEAPASPTALTATGGDGQVTLAWSTAFAALTYNVKRSTVSGGPYATVSPGVKGSHFVDTTIVNGTTYYYVVSASNVVGESANSNEASATPKARPDLVVSTLTVPSVSASGAAITVTVVTKNQGGGASNPTMTRFYLSRTPGIDANSWTLDNPQTIPSLGAGATLSATPTVDLPALSVGTYFLIAKADADNTENETNEFNNTTARSISIGPDLIVTTSGPSTAAPGGTITIADTVKNQGGAAADATTLRYYLSPNALFDSADPPLSPTRPVPALPAGATNSGSTTLTIPAGTTAGSYFLFAKADADNVVTETQEGNNTSAKIIQIGGDLIVSAFTVPANGGNGTRITVTDTTKNNGAASVPASTTRFYFSTNLSFDSSDTPLDGSRPVPALDPGMVSTGQTMLTLPTGLAIGSYFVIAVADGDNAVPESVETNNATARAIAIGPDLTLTAVSVPFSVTAGSTVSVNATVTNQGGDPAAASTLRFYLSNDLFFDASDTPLADRAVPALAGVTSSVGSTSITIPAGKAPGTYYVIAVVDADGVVAESIETNNTRVSVISVR